MALSLQRIWYNNDYINTARLMDTWLFYEVDGRAIYIYILGSQHKYTQSYQSLYPHYISIIFPTYHYITFLYHTFMLYIQYYVTIQVTFYKL